eukprot:GHVQ01015676.1.p1 GENE.GHVQ01015676.1~~GHVQ01015676.1.p1  ORF type:complete len:1286 (-),score=271.97 GHVQ01015676.1:166-4023(-)
MFHKPSDPTSTTSSQTSCSNNNYSLPSSSSSLCCGWHSPRSEPYRPLGYSHVSQPTTIPIDESPTSLPPSSSHDHYDRRQTGTKGNDVTGITESGVVCELFYRSLRIEDSLKVSKGPTKPNSAPGGGGGGGGGGVAGYDALKSLKGGSSVEAGDKKVAGRGETACGLRGKITIGVCNGGGGGGELDVDGMSVLRRFVNESLKRVISVRSQTSNTLFGMDMSQAFTCPRLWLSLPNRSQFQSPPPTVTNQQTKSRYEQLSCCAVAGCDSTSTQSRICANQPPSIGQPSVLPSASLSLQSPSFNQTPNQTDTDKTMTAPNSYALPYTTYHNSLHTHHHTHTHTSHSAQPGLAVVSGHGSWESGPPAPVVIPRTTARDNSARHSSMCTRRKPLVSPLSPMTTGSSCGVMNQGGASAVNNSHRHLAARSSYKHGLAASTARTHVTASRQRQQPLSLSLHARNNSQGQKSAYDDTWADSADAMAHKLGRTVGAPHPTDSSASPDQISWVAHDRQVSLPPHAYDFYKQLDTQPHSAASSAFTPVPDSSASLVQQPGTPILPTPDTITECLTNTNTDGPWTCVDRALQNLTTSLSRQLLGIPTRSSTMRPGCARNRIIDGARGGGTVGNCDRSLSAGLQPWTNKTCSNNGNGREMVPSVIQKLPTAAAGPSESDRGRTTDRRMSMSVGFTNDRSDDIHRQRRRETNATTSSMTLCCKQECNSHSGGCMDEDKRTEMALKCLVPDSHFCATACSLRPLPLKLPTLMDVLQDRATSAATAAGDESLEAAQPLSMSSPSGTSSASSAVSTTTALKSLERRLADMDKKFWKGRAVHAGMNQQMNQTDSAPASVSTLPVTSNTLNTTTSNSRTLSPGVFSEQTQYHNASQQQHHTAGSVTASSTSSHTNPPAHAPTVNVSATTAVSSSSATNLSNNAIIPAISATAAAPPSSGSAAAAAFLAGYASTDRSDNNTVGDRHQRLCGGDSVPVSAAAVHDTITVSSGPSLLGNSRSTTVGGGLEAARGKQGNSGGGGGASNIAPRNNVMRTGSLVGVFKDILKCDRRAGSSDVYTIARSHDQSRMLHKQTLKASLAAMEVSRMETAMRRSAEVDPREMVERFYSETTCLSMMKLKSERRLLEMYRIHEMYVCGYFELLHMMSQTPSCQLTPVVHFIAEFMRKVVQSGHTFSPLLLFQMTESIQLWEFTPVVCTIVMKLIGMFGEGNSEAIITELLRWLELSRGEVPFSVKQQLTVSQSHASTGSTSPSIQDCSQGILSVNLPNKAVPSNESMKKKSHEEL